MKQKKPQYIFEFQKLEKPKSSANFLKYQTFETNELGNQINKTYTKSQNLF